MNNHKALKNFLILFPALALAFTACGGSKDYDEERYGKGVEIILKAKDITNPPSNNDINEVRLVAGNGIPLATSKWNDGFELLFPRAVSSYNLTDIDDMFESMERDDDYTVTYKVSNDGAKIGLMNIYGYKNNILRDAFIRTNSLRDRTEVYVYSNADVNIEATVAYRGTDTPYDNACNLKLTKGWNQITHIRSEEGGTEKNEYTSSLSSGLFWLYDSEPEPGPEPE